MEIRSIVTASDGAAEEYWTLMRSRSISTPLMEWMKAVPAGVGRMPLLVRSKMAKPSSDSSSLMAMLSVGCVT